MPTYTLPPSSQLFYRLYKHLSQDGQYAHLYLEVYEPASAWVSEVYPQFSYVVDTSRPTLSFEWQGTREYDLPSTEWYAFSILPGQKNSGNPIELATRFAALVKRLFKNLPRASYEHAPQEIVAKLEKLHATRVHYDRRIHNLIPCAEVLPLTWERWMDDPDCYQAGTRNIHLDAFAENSQQAVELLDAKWRTIHGEVLDAWAFVQTYPTQAPRYLAWVNAGRPVRTSQYDTPDLPEPLANVFTIPSRFTR